MFRSILFGMLAMMSISLSAQTLQYDSGFSLRNSKLDHYYKMVTWDDSQYKEFNYRSISASGYVKEFINWRAIFPPGYDKNSTKKYPMIVMLHGAGESGRSWQDRFVYLSTDLRYDNNGNNLLHGGEAHRDAVLRTASDLRAFPGIVIFAQVNHSGAWESGWNLGLLNQNGNMMFKIIDYMIANYDADINRIYMHGLSNGGKGTWDLASKRPDLVTAILPMSGLPTNLTEMSNTLLTTPIWLFQGGLDVNPSPNGAQTVINTFKSKGGNPRYTLYPTTAHGTWYQAYAEPDFFSWMLAQDKRNIYVFGGAPLISVGEILKMGFSAGFLAYQWTLNGTDINGATTRYLNASQVGTYTVKFKRNDNQWYESFPVKVQLRETSSLYPVLANTGSVILPIDISAANTVNLVAPTGYSEYLWYKNGSQVATSTTSTRTIATGVGSSTAAGDYTVKVKGSNGIISQPSNVITVFYKTPHESPTPPVQSTPFVISSTQVLLKWSDSPSEAYYEIWRYRRAVNGYTAELYRLVDKVGQNTTSYTDAGARPFAQYFYRIRAIGGNDGRFSNEKLVTLPEDTIIPTAPSQLLVSNISGDQATLSWNASTDNDQIASYEIFLETTLIGSTSGNSYQLTNLVPGSTNNVGVRAVDARGNRSATSTITFYVPGTAEGIAYKYYEANSLSSLQAFDFSATPTKTGIVNNFDISVRNRNDQFVFSFEGSLQVDLIGTYTFYTSSDDGSRLYINNTLVVDNDGLHATIEKSGSYTFSSTGKFPIKVTFFEGSGGEVLKVSYDPPGSEVKQLIPNNKLFLAGAASSIEKSTTTESTASEISAYPNPFTNQLSIDLNGKKSNRIDIVDPLNFNVRSYYTDGKDEVKIDVSDLPPGVYYLSVGTAKIRLLKKD